MACLAVGVAAVVAVAGLSNGIDRGLRREARQLLAADLSVRAGKAIPKAMTQAIDALVAARPGARQAEARELATVVSVPAEGDTPGPSALVQLKAVGDGYPFYGEVATSPARPLAIPPRSRRRSRGARACGQAPSRSRQPAQDRRPKVHRARADPLRARQGQRRVRVGAARHALHPGVRAYGARSVRQPDRPHRPRHARRRRPAPATRRPPASVSARHSPRRPACASRPTPTRSPRFARV